MSAPASSLWTAAEIEMLKNSIVPPGRSWYASRTKAHKMGMSFRPKGGNPRYPVSKETEQKIVDECRKCGNHQMVGQKFGVSRNTVIDVLKRTGHADMVGKPFRFNPAVEHVVFEGNNFAWKKGSWIASSHALRRSGKYNLAKILWERWYGVYPDKGYNAVYKDGNHRNLTKENLQMMKVSDAVKLRYNDPMYKACNLASICMASLIQRITETQNPEIARKRGLKSAATRKAKYNDIGQRVWNTRKKNAEKRGFFYTPESRKKMSDAKKGKPSPHKGHFKQKETNG